MITQIQCYIVGSLKKDTDSLPEGLENTGASFETQNRLLYTTKILIQYFDLIIVS